MQDNWRDSKTGDRRSIEKLKWAQEDAKTL